MDELILVDGATGFVGSNLVEYMCSKGYNVRATGRNLNRLDDLKKFGAEVVRCDLLNKEDIKNKRLLEGVDKIVHCTGCIDMGAGWDEAYNGNVQTAKNLYEVALDYDVKKVIHFSSVAVYGKQAHGVIKEDNPKNAKDNYGKTKWLGEQAGLKLYEENGLPITAIRPTIIYGPRDSGFGYFLAVLVTLNGEFRKKKLVISSKKKTQLLSVKNVAEAVRFLLEEQGTEGESYNVADPTIMQISDIWRCFSEFLPYPETRHGIINPLLNSNTLLSLFSKIANTEWGKRWFDRMIDKRLDDVRKKYNLVSPTPAVSAAVGGITSYIGKHDIIYDTSSITNLGYRPVYSTTEEGVRDTMRWYMDNGWMPDYGKTGSSQ